ncbi:hypothetical protein E3N88_29930 [Mikania micrantha]|uniref:Integrase catalytic domain-containing protein n=1 Tax=Mikania micrantha TaxID=192012 RepID=A0A5N6MMB5_9ASTR|nr:hypothetical protein E3N88_29930 [Mikania micrantha]
MKAPRFLQLFFNRFNKGPSIDVALFMTDCSMKLSTRSFLGLIEKEGSSLSFQCPILTATNYPVWSLRIKAIFRAHRIWEAIEPGKNVDPRKDNSAVAYLYQSLPEDLVLQIAHCEHAKDIWDAIKTRHLGVERVMEAWLQTLKAEFEVARMKDNEKIDDFAAKLAGISSKSAALGSIIEETTLVRKLLTAIQEIFLNIAATLEQLVDLKTVKFQRKGTVEAESEGIAMTTPGAEEEAEVGLVDVDEALATVPTHTREGRMMKADCPTRKTDERANLAHATTDGPTLLMAVASQKERIYLSEKKVFPASYESEDQVWYLDTWATNHMSGNKELFTTLDTNIEGTVRFGDNSCVKVEGRGSILLECKTGDQKLLTNILYIPFLKSSIFSLGQADEGGCQVLIKQGTLTITDPDGSVLMKVKRSTNRLYKIDLKVATPICLLTEISNPSWLWHACLGHPFPDQTTFRAEAPLMQVYGDLCGPFTPTTAAGNRKINVLRTDKGGEFNSTEFKQYCEEEEISRQLTAPYTPQQNGVVERRNRTILNATRSMLCAMSMPQDLWAKSVRHAVHILNRVPTRGLKDKTPYEALKGRNPKLDHLRVFGCVGYVKVPTNLLKKLDYRSNPMVHLGIEPSTKAYRMYDVNNKRIVIRRDVIFDETRKWEWQHHQHSNQLGEKEFVIHSDPKIENEAEAGPSSPKENEHNYTPRSNGQGTGEESPVSIFSSPRSKVQGRGPLSHPQFPTCGVCPRGCDVSRITAQGDTSQALDRQEGVGAALETSGQQLYQSTRRW